jgi:alpha-tubulin suppressor-like RCC1 family protein
MIEKKILTLWLDNQIQKGKIKKVEWLEYDKVRVWTDNNQSTAKGIILGPLPPKEEVEIWATGPNWDYELGIGETDYHTDPDNFEYDQIYFITDDNVKEIIPGTYQSLMIKEDGSLWGAGYNPNQFLGTEDESLRVEYWSLIDIGPWKQISHKSLSSTAGIKENGTLWTWGWGGTSYDPPLYSASLLGHGDVQNRTVATQVGTDTDWKFVHLGNDILAVIKEDGTLWVCGWNGYYQLGLGHTDNQTTLQQVGTDTDWEWIGSNVRGATFALKEDGTLWSWGTDTQYGTLGLGATTQVFVPTQIGSDSDWESVISDGFSVSALKENGTLWTWGYSNYGYSGHDGVPHPLTVPTQLGTDTWKKISTHHHLESTAGLKTDGTAWGWGGNWNYQMGVGEIYGFPKTKLNDGLWDDVWMGYTQVFYKKIG